VNREKYWRLFISGTLTIG